MIVRMLQTLSLNSGERRGALASEMKRRLASRTVIYTGGPAHQIYLSCSNIRRSLMMRKLLMVSLIWAGALTSAPQAFGQTTEGAAAKAGAQVGTSITPNRVIGDVTAIDPAAMSVTLKVDAHAGAVIAILNSQTIYYRAKSDILSRAATAT